ncbi:unnamed protein product [Porites evermanni]|uniref:Multidrug resistance-associated protein 1 n=1 Tax=Porites evermanni TaxID=104178 RepID=A0ABN8MCU7_9CNID|nr:unnamed protein product [Porites evermanni]
MSDLSPADRGEASLGHLNLGQDTCDDVGLELPVIEINKDHPDSGHGNEEQNADDWWNHVQTVVINEENANCLDDINRKNSTGFSIQGLPRKRKESPYNRLKPEVAIKKIPCPAEKANFLSKLTFWWFTRFVLTGSKRTLSDADLWDLGDSFQASNVITRAKGSWKQEQTKCFKQDDILSSGYPTFTPEVMTKEGDLTKVEFSGTQRKPNKKTPSLVRALTKVFWLNIVLAALFKIANDIVQFVQPLLLDLVIEYVGDKNNKVESWKGFIFAVAMFVTAIVQSFMLQYYFHYCYLLGMKVKTALLGLIYEKALLLNNASRRQSSAGEMVNLMSVDTQRIMDLATYVNMLWSSPLQILVAIYLLSVSMGISILAGVGVLVLMIPLNLIVTRQSRVQQVNQLVEKDSRILIMNEVLSGIKVLKLYAWEESFLSRIMHIRNNELRCLRNASCFNAVIEFTFTCAPFLVSFATFGVYILTGNELTASKAFLAMSLFNIIRFPFTILPFAVISFVQALVSIKRITEFLNLEEVNSGSVQKTMPSAKKGLAIHVKNGLFSWDKDEMPILENINLDIPVGSLVAVVGPVGSGKSSLLSAFLGETEKLEGVAAMEGSVAYVSQQVWMQNSTLRNNITFGKPFNSRMYQKVIDSCALEADLEIVPGGDMTEIGERGINLSGGQRQRISLARAVYSNADIYLFDDPLSAVDSQVGKHIFDHVIGPRGTLRNKVCFANFTPFFFYLLSSLPGNFMISILTVSNVFEAVGVKILPVYSVSQKFVSFMHYITFDQNFILHEISRRCLFLNRVHALVLLYKFVTSYELLGRLSRGFFFAISGASNFKHFEQLFMTLPGLGLLTIMEFIKRARAESLLSVITSDSGNVNFCASSQRYDTLADMMTTKEEAEIGGVKLTVFWRYFKSMSVCLFGAFFLCLLFAECWSVAARMWLAHWSSTSTEANSTSQQPHELGIYGGLGLSQAVFVLLACFMQAFGSVMASRSLHNGLLTNILHSPMTFFESNPLGRIINRFSKDMEMVDDLVPRTLITFLRSILELSAVLFIISYVTPLFLSVILPLGILYTLIQRIFMATARQLRRMESVKRSPIYSHFFETLNGVSTIRAYSQEQRFIQENFAKVDENQMAYYPYCISDRWLQLRLEFIGSCVILFAALFAVISRDKIDSGMAGLSIVYALQITVNLNSMVRRRSQLESSIVSVERVKEYSETPTEAAWSIPDIRPPNDWPQSGSIVFQDFDLKYRQGCPLVLKNVNCIIHPGEKIGIVGRTGAGKSTLTQALFRILERAGGKIIIDQLDIATIGLHDLRQRLTIIPQDPVLFSGTLRLNLDPFSKHTDEELWQAIEASHLKDLASETENGLQFPIIEGGDNLSVGQRQLVCLARALLRKGKILVLDEATSAVDMETDDLIQQTIRREFADRTVFTIAHRLNTIMDYTRIMVLDKGFVVEFDTPINLLAQKGIFYSMAQEAGIA